MNRKASRPIVLVPACHRSLGDHPYQVVGQKYVDAVRLAGCQPLVVSATPHDELDTLLPIAHGLFLTGSPSNVHPSHFDEEVLDPALPLDRQRDAWTLAAIPRVLALGMPLFAICRGFQEVNVALGGSLHQAVQQLPGMLDHREASEASAPEQYDFAHDIDIADGGLLSRLLDERRVRVNSLHGQGLNRLGAGLRVEARAPDGLVEAFTVADAPGFNLGVQWHPEWRAGENPVSLRILRAFGAACAAYRDRQPNVPAPDR